MTKIIITLRLHTVKQFPLEQLGFCEEEWGELDENEKNSYIRNFIRSEGDYIIFDHLNESWREENG